MHRKLAITAHEKNGSLLADGNGKWYKEYLILYVVSHIWICFPILKASFFLSWSGTSFNSRSILDDSLLHELICIHDKVGFLSKKPAYRLSWQANFKLQHINFFALLLDFCMQNSLFCYDTWSSLIFLKKRKERKTIQHSNLWRS